MRLWLFRFSVLCYILDYSSCYKSSLSELFLDNLAITLTPAPQLHIANPISQSQIHLQRLNNEMAPTTPKSSNKTDTKKSKPLSSASKVNKKKDAKRPPPQEVKAKARTEPSQLKKKQKREYTEEELDLPKLNMITPAGVVKPKGKKKGKKFVDDAVRLSYLLWVYLWFGIANFVGGDDDDSGDGECGSRGTD